MTFRLLQFSPQASTRVRMRMIPERWIRGYEYSQGATFLPSWMEVDPDPQDAAGQRRINWGAISGLALCLAVSGGFWLGLGLLVVRALR